MDIEQLSDEELKQIHERYESLSCQIKKRLGSGLSDTGSPEIEDCK